ncbi:MAG: hypothetical protein ACKOTB_08705 [Planctomycetia bacterium]
MADLVFAFDPALDRPLPRLDAAPAEVAEAVAAAAMRAFLSAVTTARREEAAALVLFGRVLDPRRASPAQAFTLRSAITELAALGCRTIWLAADSAAAAEAARMLGEPAGLEVLTPASPLRLEIRGLGVELVAAAGRHAASPRHPHDRRIILGCDGGLWNAQRFDDEPATADVRTLTGGGEPLAGDFRIWGSRCRPLTAGVHHLPALQARSPHESAAGSCGVLTLLDHPADDDGGPEHARRDPLASRGDWRHAWREVPTHHVLWRTISVPSATGGDEELAAEVWSALESLHTGADGPLEIIRCHVECGTSVARRVRVAEISAETLARVRHLCVARACRGWCQELLADPCESLAALGHSRSGARPGSTTSFSTALADIVGGIEHDPARTIPADLARESAWLALELIEST